MNYFRVWLLIALLARVWSVCATKPAGSIASENYTSVNITNTTHGDLIHSNGSSILLATDVNGHGNGSNTSIVTKEANCSSCNASTAGAQGAESGLSFDYHKPLFPLDWHHDGLTLVLAAIGLLIASSGGIGGGGILVPLFMLVLGFRPKHAIALSNFTIFGGAIANTALNARKKHPKHDGQIIDWDLIVIMEPLTIFGAVFGSLLGKVLPNIVLTVSLVLILAFMGQRTLKKGVDMWTDETRTLTVGQSIELMATGEDLSGNGLVALASDLGQSNSPYNQFESDNEGGGPSAQQDVGWKIGTLTACFAGICALTVLKGGGYFKSPFGFECGTFPFWALYFGVVPWVLVFAIYFRQLLLGEFKRKVHAGYTFASDEVQWDQRNTIRYPAICAVSGLLAGLFGVGGGIVKGPLMLEMGIMPSVASASAAAMILYTSAAASTSFAIFGLLHKAYGLIFFLLGVCCTAFGQYWVGKWVKRHKRESPIVLSIGLVITLSSILVAVDTVFTSSGLSVHELFRIHAVCTSEV